MLTNAEILWEKARKVMYITINRVIFSSLKKKLYVGSWNFFFFKSDILLHQLVQCLVQCTSYSSSILKRGILLQNVFDALLAIIIQNKVEVDQTLKNRTLNILKLRGLNFEHIQTSHFGSKLNFEPHEHHQKPNCFANNY